MPLLFDISDAHNVIDKIDSQYILDLYNACGKNTENELPTMRDTIPYVIKTGQLWMVMKPFHGNWFCVNSNKTELWIDGGTAQGRFLTEIQSSDLHRFFPVLESVRRSEKSVIVRHCNELNGKITFWDTLVIVCKQHKLVDELYYILVSQERDIGDYAIHDLFESSPIAQLVVLPLKNSQNKIYDAYIIEANERARRLFKQYLSSGQGRQIRQEIVHFEDDNIWASLLRASESNDEMNTSVGQIGLSIHIQKMSGYWVIHMIEDGRIALEGDMVG